MTRREMILRTGTAAAGLGLAGCSMTSSRQSETRKVLFFSKSSAFEHLMIQRKGSELSFAEKRLAELGPRHGIEFTFSKDGSLFNAAYLAGFDAYAFYTSGDLTTSGTDKNPPMSAKGKAALLDAIRKGRGFVGIHSATDTFRTPDPAGADPNRYQNDGDRVDPYLRMLGAEFIIHGKEQIATIRVADSRFPGAGENDFALLDEWYSFKNFSNDLHVLLVQETKDMEGAPYRRPSYPATWARKHGRGRVFYTSMGHREEVWMNPLFEQVLFGGIAWAVGNTAADVPPDIGTVTPGYADLPPKSG
jgi:type 1 glutamine amidotransferase